MNIDSELKEFKEFKMNYTFVEKDIIDIDGVLYCDNISLIDEDGKNRGLTEKWLNVGFNNSGSLAKVLSNLFPYEFEFRGMKFNSIESFFQGIKFIDKDMQKLVFSYSGKESNYVKECSSYNWKETGIVYLQGEEIDRFSEKYDDIVDEVYISALQNPLYRSALMKCDVDIIHLIGDINKSDTVFTRYEFEKELNCLKDFLKSKEKI